MKYFLFITFCLFFSYLCPIAQLDKAYGVQKQEDTSLLSAVDLSEFAKEISDNQSDRTGEIVAIKAMSSRTGDIMPHDTYSLARHIRVLTTRVQFRYQNTVILLKKFLKTLSSYLTTLINHISLSYTSIKFPSWQYATDCYVFAFRHIII